LYRHLGRLSFVIEGTFLVELEAVDRLTAVPEAHVLTYVELTGLPVGLRVCLHYSDSLREILRVSRLRP
jgi:hypothetical protein